jgi:hypothetical protein
MVVAMVEMSFYYIILISFVKFVLVVIFFGLIFHVVIL